MNGYEIKRKLAEMNDEKILRIYNNLKNDDEADCEIFFRVVDEKESRNL